MLYKFTQTDWPSAQLTSPYSTTCKTNTNGNE